MLFQSRQGWPWMGGHTKRRGFSSSLRFLQKLCGLHGCGGRVPPLHSVPMLTQDTLLLNCLVFIEPTNLWPVNIPSWEIVVVVELSMRVFE